MTMNNAWSANSKHNAKVCLQLGVLNVPTIKVFENQHTSL